MMTHKAGIVIAPYDYRGWDAEVYGRTDDTGGYFIFLRKDGYVSVDFWGETLDGVYGQLGPVATTANRHLLVNLPPFFVGISLLASWQAASIPPTMKHFRSRGAKSPSLTKTSDNKKSIVEKSSLCDVVSRNWTFGVPTKSL